MDKAFFDIRRQAYITGAVYSLARADCKECKEEPLQKELQQYQLVKFEQIGKFLDRNPVEKEEDCMICGYDPMNMIIYGRQVLCTHFVALRSGERMQFLNGPVLLELVEGDDRKVGKYWVLTQEKS